MFSKGIHYCSVNLQFHKAGAIGKLGHWGPAGGTKGTIVLLVEYEREEMGWLYPHYIHFVPGLTLAVPLQEIRSKELMLGNKVTSLAFL